MSSELTENELRAKIRDKIARGELPCHRPREACAPTWMPDGCPWKRAEAEPRKIQFDLDHVTPLMVHRLVMLLNEKRGSVSSVYDEDDRCILTFHIPFDEPAVILNAHGEVALTLDPGDTVKLSVNLAPI